MAIGYTKVFQFVLLLAIIYNVNAQTFDVSKYGAKPGVEASQGILAAWKAACASAQASKVWIPKGTYNVRQLKLEGPCKAPITLQLEGILKAPADVSQQLKNTDWISIINIQGFTMNGGGSVDGNGKTLWGKKKAKQVEFVQPTNLGLNFLTNARVHDISSVDSKMFHINILGSKNITLERVKTIAPGDSPNTDGIHIGRSNGVHILDSKMHTGDDCISIGDGAQDVHVTKAECGPGHGIAIGSLGKYKNEEPVRGIWVKGSSLTNTLSGLRIKTWEDSPVGEASNIHFEDITLTNVLNPILIDQEYCPAQNCPAVQAPSRVKISQVTFRGIRGSSASKETVKIVCSKSNPCTGVEIGDINLTYNGKDGPPTSTCANVQPKLVGKQNPPVCTAKQTTTTPTAEDT